MMPTFSEVSRRRLAECDPRIQAVVNEVIKHFDCVVLCGHRGKADQDAAVASGNSKTPWPRSKHNALPSLAADVAPFDRPSRPVDWDDRERLTFFAGFVLAVARMQGVPLRWGGDWNQDTRVADNSFDDLAHFELV
jgi:hypothetical protein